MESLPVFDPGKDRPKILPVIGADRPMSRFIRIERFELVMKPEIAIEGGIFACN